MSTTTTPPKQRPPLREGLPYLPLVCDILALTGLVIIPALYAMGYNGRVMATGATLIAAAEYFNGRLRERWKARQEIGPGWAG